MSTIKDLSCVTSRNLFGYANQAFAGFAINAATAATFKTQNACHFLFDGVMQSCDPLTDVPFSQDHATQPQGFTCYFAVGVKVVNDSMVVATYQGAFVSTDAINNGAQAAMPIIPDYITPMTLIRVRTQSAPFHPGVTALDASGVLVDFFDVQILPEKAPRYRVVIAPVLT